jgi:UDP-2,3-diacylglucosamine pyrophosphatase LpxH
MDVNAAAVTAAFDRTCPSEALRGDRAVPGFLAAEAVQAQALYILGDLFEAWVG